MGAGHDHGASAVDVEGELRAPLRRLGLVLLVLGALALSGGLWLVSRSRTQAGPQARVEAALELLAGLPADELAARAAQRAAQGDAAAWWWAGELARRAGLAESARERFARAAQLAPERAEPHDALRALERGGAPERDWVDEAGARALEALLAPDFPSPRR
jgi:cytochrome c-type biogenesis protein CcmH/NrfG